VEGRPRKLCFLRAKELAQADIGLIRVDASVVVRVEMQRPSAVERVDQGPLPPRGIAEFEAHDAVRHRSGAVDVDAGEEPADVDPQ